MRSVVVSIVLAWPGEVKLITCTQGVAMTTKRVVIDKRISDERFTLPADVKVD